MHFKCDPAVTLPRNMSYWDLARLRKGLDTRVFTSGLPVLGIVRENPSILQLRLEKYLKVHLYNCMGSTQLPEHRTWEDMQGPVLSGEEQNARALAWCYMPFVLTKAEEQTYRESTSAVSCGCQSNGSESTFTFYFIFCSVCGFLIVSRSYIWNQENNHDHDI